ncbi:MAG: c-type cytochrome [Gammaproteobacteria bacterium]
MSRSIGLFLCCAIVAGSGSIAYGAGNANAGKTKSNACAGCHGDEGNSAVPSFPRLAGQHARYLSRQLADFKGQKRNDPSMSAMAAGLSEQDIDDLSAFYAGRTAEFPAVEGEQYVDADEEIPVTQEMIAAGRTLYVAGNEETRVAACTACHGPEAEGNGPAGFPKLKGQFLPYLIKSLNDFKEGLRTNDNGAMMQTIAGRMSKREINAVAAYLANMR